MIAQLQALEQSIQEVQSGGSTDGAAESAGPWMDGFCVDSNNKDVNSGVTMLGQLSGDVVSQQSACQEMCAGTAGITGCELIMNRANAGCYAHTSSTITHANGVQNHWCWLTAPPPPPPPPATSECAAGHVASACQEHADQRFDNDCCAAVGNGFCAPGYTYVEGKVGCSGGNHDHLRGTCCMPADSWIMDGFTEADCECCGCSSAGGWSGCPACPCCGGGRCGSYCSWLYKEESEDGGGEDDGGGERTTDDQCIWQGLHFCQQGCSLENCEQGPAGRCDCAKDYCWVETGRRDGGYQGWECKHHAWRPDAFAGQTIGLYSPVNSRWVRVTAQGTADSNIQGWDALIFDGGDNRYRKEPGVGGWGGICTCPDGHEYEVGDNMDACASLACVGGTSGACSNGGISASSAGMAVTCGNANRRRSLTVTSLAPSVAPRRHLLEEDDVMCAALGCRGPHISTDSKCEAGYHIPSTWQECEEAGNALREERKQIHGNQLFGLTDVSSYNGPWWNTSPSCWVRSHRQDHGIWASTHFSFRNCADPSVTCGDSAGAARAICMPNGFGSGHDASKCSDWSEDCCASDVWGEPQTCKDGYVARSTSAAECPSSWEACAMHQGGIGCYGCYPPDSTPSHPPQEVDHAGCMKKLAVASAIASSEINGYSAANVYNGKMGQDGGADWSSVGEGVGAWITLYFNTFEKVTQLKFAGRVRDDKFRLVEVELSDGSKQQIELKNTDALESYPMETHMAIQPTSSVRITCISVWGEGAPNRGAQEIELWSDRCMSVADSSGNLARACGADGLQPCTATQSSNQAGGVAARAVDANKDTGYISGRSCTHTTAESNPWWMIDLERVRSVKSVKLWNRADCCSDRLNGFEVWIGDTASSYDANSRCSAGAVAPLTSPHSLHVDCVGTGRYLFISLPGSNKILTLCEVEVYDSQKPATSDVADTAPEWRAPADGVPLSGQEADDACRAIGKRLCSYTELCPHGEGKPPVGMPGDHTDWMPFSDQSYGGRRWIHGGCGVHEQQYCANDGRECCGHGWCTAPGVDGCESRSVAANGYSTSCKGTYACCRGEGAAGVMRMPYVCVALEL